jgi:hypothetical protein
VRFPVWQRSARLPRDEEVLGVRLDDAAKAYPTAAVLAAGVVNDRLGEVSLVVVAEPGSGALRAYRRGEREIRRAAGGTLVDERGTVWTETEAALLPPAESGETPLVRQPAVLAFWFAWYGFFPATEVWEPPAG